MNGFEMGLLTIDQAAGMYYEKTSKKDVGEYDNSINFSDVLKEKTKEVKFSKHASQRMTSRNIILSELQMNRLNDGVDRARDKNINESLVMMDDLAFIVNVKNNTVITALEGNEENVFTNIDGAVIV